MSAAGPPLLEVTGLVVGKNSFRETAQADAGKAISAVTDHSTSPIVLSSTAHGFSANDPIYVAGVQGLSPTSGAPTGGISKPNGYWSATTVTADTITLLAHLGEESDEPELRAAATAVHDVLKKKKSSAR